MATAGSAGPLRTMEPARPPPHTGGFHGQAPTTGTISMDQYFLKRGLLVVLFAAFIVGAASAQNISRAQQQALRSACESDMRAVCAGVRPGGGRLLQCIQANPEKISQGCKDAVASIQASQSQ